MSNAYQLLALKCDNGYIKGRGEELITTASLDKASVFPLEKAAEVEAIYQQLLLAGTPGLRKVTLRVSEEDSF